MSVGDTPEPLRTAGHVTSITMRDERSCLVAVRPATATTTSAGSVGVGDGRDLQFVVPFPEARKLYVGQRVDIDVKFIFDVRLARGVV